MVDCSDSALKDSLIRFAFVLWIIGLFVGYDLSIVLSIEPCCMLTVEIDLSHILNVLDFLFDLLLQIFLASCHKIDPRHNLQPGVIRPQSHLSC